MWFADLLSAVFAIGIILIYIPQYYKIIVTCKSSLGFSILFLFLGVTASGLGAVNALFFYKPNWDECQGFSNCFQNLTGFFILIEQYVLFLIQFSLLFHYDHSPVEINNPQFIRDRKKFFRVTFFGSLGIILSAVIGSTILINTPNISDTQRLANRHSWTDFLDIIISGMFLLHYIPQIIETLQLRRTGSISLISLGTLCPGSFVWTGYLYYQSNNKVGLWVPYLLVAISQAILLSICLYYEFYHKLPPRLTAPLDRLNPFSPLLQEDSPVLAFRTTNSSEWPASWSSQPPSPPPPNRQERQPLLPS